jgi:hypothetical protein
VKRRTRLIVIITATAVVVASIVLARFLSGDGSVVEFGAGQAALFFAFAVASLILFAAVLMDFDKWVDTVPPVPKRAVRRWTGRGTRRIGRALGVVLAYYGAVMTWVWSRVGVTLSWTIGGLGACITHLSAWLGRVGSAGLVRYRDVVGWFWSNAGRLLAWALGRSGAGLTVLWVGIVRGGERAVILYRAGASWLWPRAGHAVVRLGTGLTTAWAWLARVGQQALVRYRFVMQRVWSHLARAVAWTLIHVGAGLTALFGWITRAGTWSIVRSRRGIKLLWLAAVGRGDEATPKPIRRWYTATVDAAFGIPPDDTTVDVFGGRQVPAPRRENETVGAAGPSEAGRQCRQ